jgi:3-deoxy-manno-octulosonate cytidylyltransferase (CMP-KDO synthetase)
MPLNVPSAKKPNSTKVIAAIPARFSSTRLPGKPLAEIGGKTMIRRVYERTASARGIDGVLVATDDQRIAKEVASFGGEVVLTRSDHPSGTDRLAEVFRDREVDVIVNVQGDEPFIEPEVIESLIEPFLADPDLMFATLKTRIVDPNDLFDPTIAKLVVDENDFVLYFSRAPIPFVRDAMEMKDGRIQIEANNLPPVFKQVGLYAYRREFLLQMAAWAPAPIEQAEKLEQLRALYHGVRIKAVTVSHEGFSVDTPEDLERARRRVASA